MKILHLFLVAALFCSTSAHETASSGKVSKRSSGSDQQRLVARRMDTTVNDTSKDYSEENDTENTPLEFTDAPEPEEYADEPTLERQPVEAQVKLSNVDIDDLTPEETMFFESTFRKAIQFAQDQEQGSEDEVTIGAILVENGHGLHKNDNNRALRGGRELGFSWFNIWTVIETFRCSFCYDYDDDDTDHYEEWKKARPTPAPTRAPTSRPTYAVDDDALIAWYNERLGGGSGRRHLGVSESNTSLEDILCQLLREGPYECFHSVGECSLVVSKW